MTPIRTPSFLVGTTLSLLLACASLSAQPARPTADATFVQKAASGGMAEVETGRMAQQKGQSDRIKQYGTHMVEDHSKTNDELKKLATNKGLQIPAAPDAEHQQARAKLDAASGVAFDQAYSTQTVEDHRKTIALFEQQAKNGQDAELKAFAAKTLPALREHLKMAQALK